MFEKFKTLMGPYIESSLLHKTSPKHMKEGKDWMGLGVGVTINYEPFHIITG
jgi:hypothetical protein